MATELPEVVGVVGGDRPQHRAVAGVVGGEHQVPGAEANVEILEVAGGRVDGALGIAAGVDPIADLEPIGARGARHELPDAAGADTGARAGVEAAFDHRHVEEILGQPLALQGLLEQLAIASGAAQPPGHHRVPLRIALEVVEVAQHLGVPAHRQIRELQAAQPLGVGRGRRSVDARGRLGRAHLGRHVAAASPLPGKRARGRRPFGAAPGCGRLRASRLREGLLLEAADLSQLRRLGCGDFVDGDSADGAPLCEAPVSRIGRPRLGRTGLARRSLGSRRGPDPRERSASARPARAAADDAIWGGSYRIVAATTKILSSSLIVSVGML